MARLSKPVRKMLAVGILVLILASIWIFVAGPMVVAAFDVRERITSEREVLGRLMTAERALSAAPREPKSGAMWADLYLKGKTEAIALANLQAHVVSITSRQGVRPQTTRMMQAFEREGLKLAGVQLELAAPIASIQKVLHALESSRPMLFVEQLALEPLPALLQGENAEPGRLRANIQVFGVLPPGKE
jgi:general secretion pathway protein M